MKKIMIIGIVCIAGLSFLFLRPSESEIIVIPKDVIEEPVAIVYPSLEERVGQLIAVGHWANTPLAETTDYVSRLGIGSVIVMEAPADESLISEWTSAWQAAASTSLLISIDQEGGVVSRLRSEDHIQLPQPDITDTSTANAVASARAEALYELGINSNYAPVLDRSVNPDSFMYDRVFREPGSIASLADAMVRGYQSNNILAVPKHYPGHPDTSDDSHITLPILEMSTSTYYEHTEQFAELFTLGNTQMLMTAHVLVTPLDTERPATVSPVVLNDLRNRLNYDGVVITDDLAMQAISDRWTHEDAAVLALQAGADMIMLAAEPEHTETVHAAIVEAVKSGALSEARVNEAYDRVMSLKTTLLSQR